jgi:hypothetical protein
MLSIDSGKPSTLYASSDVGGLWTYTLQTALVAPTATPSPRPSPTRTPIVPTAVLPRGTPSAIAGFPTRVPAATPLPPFGPGRTASGDDAILYIIVSGAVCVGLLFLLGVAAGAWLYLRPRVQTSQPACAYCGATNPSGSKFCQGCGQPLVP